MFKECSECSTKVHPSEIVVCSECDVRACGKCSAPGKSNVRNAKFRVGLLSCPNEMLYAFYKVCGECRPDEENEQVEEQARKEQWKLVDTDDE